VTAGSFALDSPLMQAVRRHLDSLKRSPDGSALYMLIERGLKRYGADSGQIEVAFLKFLHGMLERYAKDPMNDAVTRVKARLIQQRIALHLPKEQPAPSGVVVPAAAPPPEPPPVQAPPTVTAEADTQAPEPPTAPEPTPPAPVVEMPVATMSDSEAPAAEILSVDLYEEPVAEIPPMTEPAPVAAPAPAPAAEAPPPAAPETKAYEALGEELVDKVTETLTFNDEFETLLASETGALSRMDQAISDFKDLKQMLVRGLDELVQERDQLRERLHAAAGYLKAAQVERKQLKSELSRVRKHGLNDELTGLPRREGFIKTLDAEIGRARRFGFSVALALIDIDGLDHVNERYGREAGDAVLRCYATEILSTFRSYDIVARYGEDEFAVLFPNTQKEGAARALEKVQKRVDETFLTHAGESFALPKFASVLTLYFPGERAAQLLKRTDEALHQAKLSGMPRIVIALPTG
jgi:diguanylate cyclase (GGDEF)-like protein